MARATGKRRPYAYYRLTAEKLPGFVSDAVSITLGGTGGRVGSVRDGDIVVLPTGAGHYLVEASTRFSGRWNNELSRPKHEPIHDIRQSKFGFTALFTIMAFRPVARLGGRTVRRSARSPDDPGDISMRRSYP